MKKYYNPNNMSIPAGPYTHLIEAGEFVFISGQAPLDQNTNQLIKGSFEEEATLVFENIQKALNAVSLDFEDVVNVKAHLSDLKYATQFNEIYQRYFIEPFPTRTTVGSLLGGIKIEVDCIAYKGK